MRGDTSWAITETIDGDYGATQHTNLANYASLSPDGGSLNNSNQSSLSTVQTMVSTGSDRILDIFRRPKQVRE